MNPRAAKELLDVIMLDEFVARRKALDDWSRRWVATMHVEALNVHSLSEARGAKKQLLTEILNGLVQDEVNVLHWGPLIGNKNSLACQMHVIMQEPRDIDAGADATRRMLKMAKGDPK
jgi:hypothetical protein